MHRELSVPVRYGLALAFFATALLLRFLILPLDGGFPYLTLFPATAAVFYLCGTRPGLLVTALSAAAGAFFFISPHWSFARESGGYYMVVVYLIGALLMALVVNQLQNYAKNQYNTLQQLQDSENRFRSFMDNSNFMSWMKDDQGRYVYMNHQYLERFHIAADWQGKTDFDLFPADTARQLRANDEQVLASQSPIVVEETAPESGGEPSYWLSTKFPYVDSEGRRFTGGIAVDISARKVAEQQIENLAFYDPLTGLPNRRLLMDRLAHTLNAGLRHQRLGALLFIDLDNFKTLNDTYGHDQGDLLLQMVAQRLKANVRKGDTLARFGGDEFILLLEDLSNNPLEAAAQAEHAGEKLLNILREPYQLGSQNHRSTPSIGVTLIGETAEATEEPLKRADLAMYQAKSAGRNTLCFFDPDIQAALTARARLETDLRAALVEQQFVLHYQPQVSGRDRLTGAEALARWRHPERGMISPAEFIPMAEETGLIVPLGCWVLESACLRLAQWASVPQLAALTIAVNVSPKQFQQIDFVDQVLAAIDKAGADPRRLKLELTESMLVSDIEEVSAKMRRLRQAGVGFALDDFGTGYSSLTYLKLLPLEQLKIDQSFVKDVLVDANDAAIARTVIALADSLGLAVIAEGVETEAQREFLAAQGCPAYQGYLFSGPIPIEAFEALATKA